jgi:hypothetical protein
MIEGVRSWFSMDPVGKPSEFAIPVIKHVHHLSHLAINGYLERFHLLPFLNTLSVSLRPSIFRSYFDFYVML